MSCKCMNTNRAMMIRCYSSSSKAATAPPFKPASIKASARSSHASPSPPPPLTHTHTPRPLSKVIPSPAFPFKPSSKSLTGKKHHRAQNQSANQKHQQESHNIVHSNSKSNSSSSSSSNSKIDAYKLNQTREQKIKLENNFHSIVLNDDTGSSSSSSPHYEPITQDNPPEVPKLEHNLDRVLFSPGVHFLQDPRTRVYNFTPFLKKIMPVSKFDFNCITQYITASKDVFLQKLTSKHGAKFFSSTSSMTSALAQFHFWLSNDRPANITNLSKNFHGLSTTFTTGTRCPTVLMCKRQEQGKMYSIDSDKSSDKEILLSLLGHSMEKLLTTSPEIFNKYHIENSHTLSEDESNRAESYHYAKIGDFIMRSQLDCHDERLPGTGTFDLKTRAVCAVRHDISHTEKNLTGYKIFKNTGSYESFEREFYELIRSALLKYSLQARIGNMDGIFVCYHNIDQIFGFQYLPLQDIDHIFHSYDDHLSYKDAHNLKINRKLDVEKIQGPIGTDQDDFEFKLSSYIADNEFRASVSIWSHVMKKIEKKLGHQSFRLVISNDAVEKNLYCLATPISNDKIDEIQRLGEITANEELESESNPESESESDISQKKQNMHRLKFQEINQETSQNCIGFKLVRKHFFNGEESNDVYYKPSSLEDKWEIRYQISEIPQTKASELYLKNLNKKEQVVWGTEKDEDDMNEQISKYLEILRAFGDKGRLREEIWKEADEKYKVWTPIKNDKNI